MDETKYKVLRFFGPGVDRRPRTIKRGLTLAEAQAHCKNPESSSRTGTSAAARAITKRVGGEWFDGYTEESR